MGAAPAMPRADTVMAEFENYQRRSGNEKANNAQFASTGAGPTLMPREDNLDTASSGAKRLTDALKEKDTEERKAREEAEERRLKWIRKSGRRLEKQSFMDSIPDDTVVGTVDEFM